MSDLRINNITDKTGGSGPVIAGVSTVTSTGAFTVPVGPQAYRGGRGRGIQGGGSSDVTVMDYVEIATEANAIDFGDLTVGRRSLGSVSSSTRGVFMGGIAGPAWTNTIDYVTISSQGGASDFGDLDSLNARYTCVSNHLVGLTGGGNDPSGYRRDIQYINIATTGNANPWGDLDNVNANQGSSCASPTRGIWMGGYAPRSGTTVWIDRIQYVNLSSKGNGKDFGQITTGTYNGGHSQSGNSTRGTMAGGYVSPGTLVNTIEYMTISTFGNAADFGDLTNTRANLSATANATRGIFMGGDPGPGSSNIIDYVTIATTGNASDFGDIPTAYQQGAALSDTHGGLG